MNGLCSSISHFAGFGGAMSGTSIFLEFLKLRESWHAWLYFYRQQSSQEVQVQQTNPPPETETGDSRIARGG